MRWNILAVATTGLLVLLTGCGKEPATAGPTGPAAHAAAPARVKLYFDLGSAAPAADAAAQLGAVVAFARAHPGAKVQVSGITGPSGDATANEELAKNRALAARNVLVGQGVAEENVHMDTSSVASSDIGEREPRVEVSVR